MTGASLATMPSLQPALVRTVRNGNAAGSGLRLYVPRALVERHGLQAGDHYAPVRLPNGRIRLTRVTTEVERIPARATSSLPADRVALHVTPEEAMALEAFLVDQDRSQRDVLLGLAKRLRRRMRARGWTTPDRGSDRVEDLP